MFTSQIYTSISVYSYKSDTTQLAVAVYMIQILRALKANSLFVCFVFNKVFLCRQTQISVHDLPASLPLSGSGYSHNVPCPVAEAKFSQDLANPSHFTVNVERKSKPSHLHFVLGLLEPIGSPGRGDPICCAHHTPEAWPVGGSFYTYPQSCSRQTEEPRSGSENPHGVQGRRQISTSDLGNPRMRSQC